jgi:fluoride ion exporter CrcB/FEX
METASAVQDGNSVVALSNVAANNLVGVALVFLGMWLARIK